MKNLLIVLFIFNFSFFNDNSSTYNVAYSTEYLNTQPPLQMFYAIQKYAEKYEIPLSYAYGIAYKETGYTGPFDYDYNQSQTSHAGALGPMQVMYPTAQMMWPDREFSKEFLLTNVDFNVETSMKYLRHLQDTYNDWEISLGHYNTGNPVKNGYSRFIIKYEPKFI